MKEIRTAMGYVETVGLAAAIAAADAALKAANVSLIGREISKGSGMVTVKFSGNVGALKAAIAAAAAEGKRVNEVLAARVIARPAQTHGPVMGYNADTMGVEEWLETKGVTEKPLSVYRPEGKRSTRKPDSEGEKKGEGTVPLKIVSGPGVEVAPEATPVEPSKSEPLPVPPATENSVEPSAPSPGVQEKEELKPAPLPEVSPESENLKPETPAGVEQEISKEPEKAAPSKPSVQKKAESSGAPKKRTTSRRTRRKKTDGDTDTSGRL